ncbi:helix-turn-helix domain-containing protein [Levilactobacillus bambusae]|uniref:Transcriptional regulator n=1 Tax=Levilactobacillus bambusae TaxID=2024736 RepID=A0A2V1MXX1_9LACO|nr:helix-turn-helix transcriptional regulator [Levilactobacillus bambusae]PWF99681.1 transcriptional regulator [Levilactobacillus bambusae]
MTFGERVKQAREQHGWTLQQMSEFLGQSPEIIADWESGKVEPTASQLQKLSRLLGVSSDWLLSGKETSAAHLYRQAHPDHPMNFWEFASRYWWLIFAVGAWIGWMVQWLR